MAQVNCQLSWGPRKAFGHRSVHSINVEGDISLPEKNKIVGSKSIDAVVAINELLLLWVHKVRELSVSETHVRELAGAFLQGERLFFKLAECVHGAPERRERTGLIASLAPV